MNGKIEFNSKVRLELRPATAQVCPAGPSTTLCCPGLSQCPVGMPTSLNRHHCAPKRNLSPKAQDQHRQSRKVTADSTGQPLIT